MPRTFSRPLFSRNEMYKHHPKFSKEELESAIKEHKSLNKAAQSLGITGKVFARQLRGKLEIELISTIDNKTCRKCLSLFNRKEGQGNASWNRSYVCDHCKAGTRKASSKNNYLKYRVRKLKDQKNNPIRKKYRSDYWKTEKGKATAKHYKGVRRSKQKSTPEVKQHILQLFNNPYKKCRYCETKYKLTLEHVLPLKRGGTHTSDNLDLACGTCNSSKKSKTEEEYKQYLLEIKKEHSYG